MNTIVTHQGPYTITTDMSAMDSKAIHDFLSNESYWARHIGLETVQKSIKNSLNFGLFLKDRQIGYARIISDFATIAYLGDVYVLDEFRGQGLSKWLMQQVMSHPELQGLRRWVLLTSTAHELYKKYGWTPIARPEWYMECTNPEVYAVKTST